MQPDPQRRAEAERILALHEGRMAPAMALVSSQFSVMQTRSQLLLTLATLTLTITGFSGPAIARSGCAARWLMAAGLMLVLGGVVLLLATLRAEWLSRMVDDDAIASLERMLAYRDGKTAGYRWQLLLLGCGIACYVAAVVVFLMTG